MRAGAWSRLLGECPPDRDRRLVGPTLGQPEERETRLWPTSQTARAAVRRLCLLGRATQSMQLGLTVVCLSCDRPVGRIVRVGGGLACLIRRLLPCPVELGQLGAVDLALAAVRNEVRLGFAPSGQRRGPLLGPAQVEQALARLDDRAVDDPDDDRRDLPGRRRDHRLVEQCHSSVDVPERDQRVTLTEAGQCRKVTVAKLVGDPGCLQVRPLRPGRVARFLLCEGYGDEQVAPLDHVESALLELPTAPRQPAPGLGQFTVPCKQHHEPEGAPRRRRRVGGIGGDPVKPGEGRDALVVAADQVRGHGQPLEVAASEGLVAGRLGQPRVRVGPCPAVIGRPTSLEGCQFVDRWLHGATPRTTLPCAESKPSRPPQARACLTGRVGSRRCRRLEDRQPATGRRRLYSPL